MAQTADALEPGGVTPFKPLPRWLQRLPTFLHTPWKLVRATLEGFVDENIPAHAASLAYYTVFSIAPTVIIVIAVVGFFFGEEAARGEIQEQLQGLMGATGAKAVEEMLASNHREERNLFASLLGIVVVVFGATGVFAALQSTLNSIWRAPPSKMNGIVAFLRARLLSFSMVLGVCFLLLVSLVISAGFSAVGKYMGGAFTDWEILLGIINTVVSLLVITALFALMFRVLPDVHIAWKDVWLGAAITSALFTLGKWLIAQYLGRAAIESSYGAAGSMAVLLAWVYYSAFILFAGALLTRMVAQHRGTYPIRGDDPVATALQPGNP